MFFGLRFLAPGAPLTRICVVNRHFQRRAAGTSFFSEMKTQPEERPKTRLLSTKSKLMALKSHVKKSSSKGWIEAFCQENSVFCEVQKEYMQEEFNLTGLRPQVENYTLALEVILGSLKSGRLELEDDARKLYGLIHSRFITSTKGLEVMLQKFENADFEQCPRSCCEHQICLPVGFSDEPDVATLRYFCPRCQQVYMPSSIQHRDIDGAYFGSTFAHLLVLTYPNKFTRPCNVVPKSGYVPRIFGFRIHNPSPAEDHSEAPEIEP